MAEDIEKLEQIRNVLISNLYNEKVNKKTTLNLFKSILSNTYYGQPSFLNVVKSSLPYEEQQELMYKDYVSNIVETSFLEDITNQKYDIQELTNILTEKMKNTSISKEFEKIYTNIHKKFILKSKDIDEIISYIKETVFESCSLCGNTHSTTSNYTEANFLPLAISSDNMKNFFWNQNVKMPICDLCKLILFCIPAGVTSATKTVKENDTYREKEMLTFINYDTDLETLLTTNENFKNSSKREKMLYNPYSELILNIVEQDKKISSWELENIFVVEFEAEYLAFSRIQYFNIKRNVAKFFKDYSELLNSIKDYKYKLELVDYILKGKDFTKVINERLRSEIGQEHMYGFSSYLATKIQYTLEILKKEDFDVKEELRKANGAIHYMYTLGNNIHDELKRNNNENKLDGYIYKMLNCIKTNNKNGFTDIAIRIIWSTGKDIPEILVKNNENINWQELGHSFISGLTSARYVKEENEEVNAND